MKSRILSLHRLRPTSPNLYPQFNGRIKQVTLNVTSRGSPRASCGSPRTSSMPTKQSQNVAKIVSGLGLLKAIKEYEKSISRASKGPSETKARYKNYLTRLRASPRGKRSWNTLGNDKAKGTGNVWKMGRLSYRKFRGRGFESCAESSIRESRPKGPRCHRRRSGTDRDTHWEMTLGRL